MTCRGEWLASYVGTYLERDVRQLLNVGDLLDFQRFLGLCAGRSGQLLNLSALASDTGISHNTAKAWLSVPEASFILFRLPPLHRNVGKRLIKAPKLYFHDSGLLCHLLGIREPAQLTNHPLRGAIFETWCASEVRKSRLNRGLPADMCFYRDRKGQEVDLVVEEGTGVKLIEVKSGQTIAPDFFNAFAPIEAAIARPGGVARLERVLIYGGDDTHTRQGTRVVSWREIPQVA